MIRARYLQRSRTRFVCSCIAVSILLAQPLAACTTFCADINGLVLFGANYDWDTGVGLVMINKRVVAKTSYTNAPAQWVSRFSSVTFNQYGRDFPTGGMNEAGVVIALMALDGTSYPLPDDRPTVGILEWIQYQLDLSADVDEIVRRSADVRIIGPKGLHYLVSDRSGSAATVEFLAGALNVHRGASLPVAVLTNDTYERSISYLRTMTGFGGRQPIPSGIGSLERFARVASMLRSISPTADPVGEAFHILEAIHQPDYTRWSIVYDTQSLTVSFRTDQNMSIRSVRLASFDGSCASPVKLLDVDAEGSDDVSALFVDYTTAKNLELVNAAYDQTPFLRGESASERLGVAQHPESSACTEQRRRRAVH